MPPLEARDILEQWFRYEEIAMHFNELIMQFRLQLLGGAGLIGTLAGYLIGEKVDNEKLRHWLRFTISGGLLVLLAAAAFLDVFYYSRLLQGAVEELKRFEGLHPHIQMSTRIDSVVGWGRHAAAIAYAAILLVLFVFVVWSFKQHRRERHGANWQKG